MWAVPAGVRSVDPGTLAIPTSLCDHNNPYNNIHGVTHNMPTCIPSYCIYFYTYNMYINMYNIIEYADINTIFSLKAIICPVTET
jgi:hypothetical protein